MTDFEKRLERISKSVKFSAPLSEMSTFRIGKNALAAVWPEDVTEICKIKSLCLEYSVPCVFIGNGSDILFDDGGFDGVIVCTSKFSKLDINENRIICECGVPMTRLANFACENSLSGLEFAYGIPGSVGGGVYMNAGAYGGEMKNVIKSVSALHNGNVVKFQREELYFGYRHSRFCGTDDLILAAEFELQSGKKDDIAALMRDYIERRRAKQPLEYPSAGSVFKRPEGYFAGKLIEDAGLKGYKTGGAMVSEKHAGFIVNFDNATSKDVIDLVLHIRKTVFEKFGVTLESEILHLSKDGKIEKI
ncbi:MAG: UDP-N-acetylmuramate dehydrogenase [Clostridia bacterium]|nr:UDP-N-acetylmuramate dehydrogenase [Clostridia bacterium]